MIQAGTNLEVADNTGAKLVRCIQVLRGSKHRYGYLGDIIVVSVKEAEPRKMVKKGEVLRAVIVRQKKPYRFKNGIYLRFDNNAVVILAEKTKTPKGSRIIGPIPRFLKNKGFGKIVEMAKLVV